MIISHVAHRWRAKLYEPGWFPWLVGGVFLDKRWLMGDDFHQTQVWLAYPVWLQSSWRKVIVVLSERKVWFWWWGAGVSSRGGSMAAWILLQNTSDHTLCQSVWTSSGLLECASKCNSQYLETFPRHQMNCSATFLANYFHSNLLWRRIIFWFWSSRRMMQSEDFPCWKCPWDDSGMLD